MATEFKLPELGEGVESADVAEIHIAVGDTLEPGQIIMELETEKAVMELPCELAGTVTKIHVSSGDTVSVGQTMLSVEESADGGKSATKAVKETAAKSDSPAAEPRAAVATASNGTGTVPVPSTRHNGNGDLPLPAGPATRRLARELGVDLGAVSGSGPGGRITSEDVARAHARRSGGGGGGIAAPPLPDFTKFGPVERESLSKLARTSAANLAVAWQTIPHVTQHDLADITELEASRKQFSQLAAKSGGPKVTMTAIAIKAVVAALKEFPKFNSSFDADRNEIVLKHYFHIGVAVDTPTGLVVPVIRDADQKSIVRLASELSEIAQKARDRKLQLADMQGGCFTITNLGGIGGTAFTPIVNSPEVAILGMSRSQEQLQLVDGELRSRLMLPLSMSYDHRVINGADAARFVAKLVSLFSDGFRLAIEA